MESSNPLLRLYRDDRRKLLEFLLSSGLIREITTPAGLAASFSDIEFDHLSADYVLECIHSGGVLDVFQAKRRYYDESSHPIAKYLQSGDVFYLLTDADSVGSPPHRVPPPITMNQRENKRDFVESHNFPGPNYPAAERSRLSGQETGINCQENTVSRINSLHNSTTRSVGLPTLKTGFVKVYGMMTCGNLLMKCLLHVCFFPG